MIETVQGRAVPGRRGGWAVRLVQALLILPGLLLLSMALWFHYDGWLRIAALVLVALVAAALVRFWVQGRTGHVWLGRASGNRRGAWLVLHLARVE